MRSVAATSSYVVEFRRPCLEPGPKLQGRIPRIARLLALAHKIDAMVRSGELKDLAQAAEVMGLTRPRVTQVCNLTLLCPTLQEEILGLPPVTKGRDPITERHLREIVAEPMWECQVVLWRAFRRDTSSA